MSIEKEIPSRYFLNIILARKSIRGILQRLYRIKISNFFFRTRFGSNKYLYIYSFVAER